MYKDKADEAEECAIVQWYENATPTSIWGCSLLTHLESFSAVPIDSIDHSVHLIPRFGRTNEYWVNVYLF